MYEVGGIEEKNLRGYSKGKIGDKVVNRPVYSKLTDNGIKMILDTYSMDNFVFKSKEGDNRPITGQ